jgi:hypothetical protein
LFDWYVYVVFELFSFFFSYLDCDAFFYPLPHRVVLPPSTDYVNIVELS